MIVCTHCEGEPIEGGVCGKCLGSGREREYKIIRIEAEDMQNADDLIELLEQGYKIISSSGGANGGGCFIVYVLEKR